jgi:hypothetical protein
MQKRPGAARGGGGGEPANRQARPLPATNYLCAAILVFSGTTVAISLLALLAVLVPVLRNACFVAAVDPRGHTETAD